MSSKERSEGKRVLVCAPFGGEAQTVATLLRQHEFDAESSAELNEVAAHLDGDVGVIVLADEAVTRQIGSLQAKLASQPTWSDVPVTTLSTPSPDILSINPSDGSIKLTASAVIVERPLSVTCLLSVVRSALRARQRQFDMRDYIRARRAARSARSVISSHPHWRCAISDRWIDRHGQPRFSTFSSWTPRAFE